MSRSLSKGNLSREGVDLVGPKKAPLVAKEDRARELARLLLSSFDCEVQSVKTARDDAKNVVGLHRPRMDHGRINPWTAGGKDTDDRCDPVGRLRVAWEIAPAWVGQTPSDANPAPSGDSTDSSYGAAYVCLPPSWRTELVLRAARAINDRFHRLRLVYVR
jgi:hypothetical protein